MEPEPQRGEERSEVLAGNEEAGGLLPGELRDIASRIARLTWTVDELHVKAAAIEAAVREGDAYLARWHQPGHSACRRSTEGPPAAA